MKKKESKTSTMKKCAVLLAAAMLLATGCGKEDEKTIGGSVQNMEPVDITSGAELRETGRRQARGSRTAGPRKGSRIPARAAPHPERAISSPQRASP